MSATSKIQARFQRMTARETSVALLVADGKANAQIAEDLGIAEKTVKNVLMSCTLKMDVSAGGSSRVRVALRVWQTVGFED